MQIGEIALSLKKKNPYRPVHICLIFCLLLLCFTAGTALAGRTTSVVVEESSDHRIVLSYRFDEPTWNRIEIDGKPYATIQMGKESTTKEKGAPELPSISRSVIIPDDMDMTVNVLYGDYNEITDVDVAPSKGILMRTVNPDDVPHTFGSAYQQDAHWPGELAVLREPYILRDYRGVVVTVFPVQYNPAKRTLMVYTEITIEMVPTGKSQTNVRKQIPDRSLVRPFHQIYNTHFLNYGVDARYSPLDEAGDMLIICHDAWASNVQSLADHKTGIGIDTTVVSVSTIGNTSTAIKAYIQNVYDTSDLAFVLLVGDSAQVATPSASGGESDPSYAKLAGTDDYPDILVGRFSAETGADVDTQVGRTIEYEQNLVPDPSTGWFWRGTGIASDQGTGDDGEYDDEHIDYIRDDLLAHGYTAVDQIYDPTGTASDVATALNAGRGIINYCGHGSTTSWSSTGFSSSHVNALINDNMLPFIFSVACVNGDFGGKTCFAEAWLRATNGIEPTGAVAAYMSSINQSWNPPMEAQDEFNLLYCAETYNTYGALCYAGSCSMMDAYGSDGANMFNTWHIFGDPSLRIVGTVSPPHGMTVAPGAGLISEGPNGGPFTPEEIIYTVKNNDEFPIDFTVSSGSSWINMSSAGGTIPVGGETYVTASISPGAGSMANGTYTTDVTFTNTTNHDGDCTRTCQLTIGVPVIQYEWNMDSDPGWSATGEWQFGLPTGNGGTSHGNPDPIAGATGSTVFGYNLSGDYSTAIGGPYYLTSDAIDCSQLSKVNMHFQRWLNTDYPPYVNAAIEISTDHAVWTEIWHNPDGQSIEDNSWAEQIIDISSVADGQPTVYIRWSHEVGSSGAYPLSGWNIDDVRIFGVDACQEPPVINSISADTCIAELGKSSLSVSATDPCGGGLTYSWIPLNGGVIEGPGSSVLFNPQGSDTPCPYHVEVTVTSGATGLSDSQVVDVYARHSGDVNGDGWVNLTDLNQIRDNFMTSGSPGWISADLNYDGWVNLNDLNLVRDNFMSPGGCVCQ